MAVYYLILYITLKGRDIRGYEKSVGGRLGGQEKAKRRNLWVWVKGKTIETYFFYKGGYRVGNSLQLTG